MSALRSITYYVERDVENGAVALGRLDFNDVTEYSYLEHIHWYADSWK